MSRILKFRESSILDPKSRRSFLCCTLLFSTASFLCLVFFIGCAFIAPDNSKNVLRWGLADGFFNTKADKCEDRCRPYGSKALPKGIISGTSDLVMRPLWGTPKKFTQDHGNLSTNLLAMAVGTKQKDLVDKMVTKFLSGDFAVMLFHYDGIVDEWNDFEWSKRVIHVSALNQTKWWFAKRFLHPDIIAEYSYIFLWDEDLGINNFSPKKYVSIIKSEGLEISQPALDAHDSEMHHQITARGRRSTVHRRIYRPNNGGQGCDASSISPPCTGDDGPVFSRAAWRCAWYMIQNDLVHAWGLDMQLGYCAQGDRTKNVGVVDSEYVIHYGLPTLGGLDKNEASSESHAKDHRADVRRRSYIELEIFRKRWRKSVKEDDCWSDPYPQPKSKNKYVL